MDFVHVCFIVFDQIKLNKINNLIVQNRAMIPIGEIL